jgi:hypothetical protein
LYFSFISPPSSSCIDTYKRDPSKSSTIEKEMFQVFHRTYITVASDLLLNI